MESRNNSSVPQFEWTNAPRFDLGLVIVLGALIPLTVIGNSLVCVAFIKFQKIRTPTNCFLFSLALSDLVVGLILIPLWIAFIATGGFREMPLSFSVGWQMLDITCSVASMSNLAGVSVERWYGVCHPFRHMGMSVKYAVFTSIASWVYALGVAFLILFYDLHNTWVIPTITCLGLFVPFIIMSVSYCAIARKIRQKAPRNQDSGRERKTIRTLLLLSAIFIICWLPFAVGSIVTNYCDACALYVLSKPALQVFPKILHYANSFVNPILYSLFSPTFKTVFKQMLHGSRRTRDEMRRRSTMLTADRSGTQRKRSSTQSSGSIVISCKDKRSSTFSDGVRNESPIVDEKM